MNDPIYTFLYLGAQCFTTLFVLGVASVILAPPDDDDDDQGGGILQPAYTTNR